MRQRRLQRVYRGEEEGEMRGEETCPQNGHVFDYTCIYTKLYQTLWAYKLQQGFPKCFDQTTPVDRMSNFVLE